MFGSRRQAVWEASASPRAPPRQGKELVMAQLPSTLGRAGPLSSDVLDLQVTEEGPQARVVTVGGEIDAAGSTGVRNDLGESF